MSYDSCDTCGETRLLAVDRCEPCDDRLRADLERVTRERDEARAQRDRANQKAETYERDWYDAKCEFGDAMAKARARIAELEAAHGAIVDRLDLDRRRAEQERDAARQDRDTWEQLCAELRVQESRVEGILADARDVPVDPIAGVRHLLAERDRLRSAATRAAILLRRVSLRHDSPPRWADEARAMAEELESAAR